jgi:TusA-related sulfurtransferase
VAGAATVIDCIGVPCPYPIVELARAVRSCPSGSEVVVLADDPAAKTDVEAWCRLKGHTFVGREEDARGPAFRVRVA